MDFAMKAVAESREARYNYERIFVKQGPPQGMTEEEFQHVSDQLRERLKQVADRTGDLGDDIFGLVQKTAFSGINTGGQSGSKPTRRTAAEQRDKAKTPRPEMG